METIINQRNNEIQIIKDHIKSNKLILLFLSPEIEKLLHDFSLSSAHLFSSSREYNIVIRFALPYSHFTLEHHYKQNFYGCKIFKNKSEFSTPEENRHLTNLFKSIDWHQFYTKISQKT